MSKGRRKEVKEGVSLGEVGTCPSLCVAGQT